MSWFQT